MTVVSYLRLNNKSGIGCADERESHQEGRFYDMAKKLSPIGNSALISYAGPISYGEEMIDKVKKNVKSDAGITQIAEFVGNKYLEIVTKKFQKMIFDKFGVSEEEYKFKNLDDKLRENITKILHDPWNYNYSLPNIIFGGYDKNEDDFKIYLIGYPGSTNKHLRYLSIGSGNDIAGFIIGNYLQKMKQEERENIAKYKGARILMEATRFAWLNVGVGGESQLVCIDEKGLDELGSKESNLLNNLLYCEERNNLNKEYVDSMFKKIIEEGVKSTDVKEEVESKTGYKNLDSCLLY